MTLHTVLFLVVSGITNGAIYALVGLGIMLIFNVTRVINIAQGEFVMLGALTTAGFMGVAPGVGSVKLAIIAAVVWAIVKMRRGGKALWALVVPLAGGISWWLLDLYAPFHFSFLSSSVLAVVTVAFLGAAMYRLTIQPVANGSMLLFVMIATGVYMTVQGLGLVFWGPDSITLPAITHGSIGIGTSHVSVQRFWILGITLALLALMWALLDRTLVGKSLRACAMNRLGARLVGVSPTRAGLIAFSASAAISAIAGILIAPVTFAGYDMGLTLGLKGFVAAIVGGFSGYTGAVIGGLAVGVVEAFAFYGLSAYGEAIVYGLIIVVLVGRALSFRNAERAA